MAFVGARFADNALGAPSAFALHGCKFPAGHLLGLFGKERFETGP